MAEADYDYLIKFLALGKLHIAIFLKCRQCFLPSHCVTYYFVLCSFTMLFSHYLYLATSEM